MNPLQRRLLGGVGALMLAGLAAAAPDAWDTYGKVSAVTCDRRPVLLQGSRTDVRVTGPCSYVRVAGEHNDIHIEVLARGTIEITGQHNDVWWQQVSRGPGPRLLDHGSSNTFHSPE